MNENELLESELLDNPLLQTEKMWREVCSDEFENGQMFCLSTVGKSKIPSSRLVLFKQITEKEICFYSNYESRKAKELEENSNASALIYWQSIDVQIRFVGHVEKMSPEKSDKYFSGRSRQSQIGAWASRQSQVITSREELMQSFNVYDKKFEGKDVPRPEFWGGYTFTPFEAQIMKRGGGRLHDSFLYTLQSEWQRVRLSP